LARLKTKHFPEMFAFIASPKRRSKCAETAHAIAALVSRVCPVAKEIADSSLLNGRLRGHDVARAEGLRALAEHFCACREGEDHTKNVLHKLLQLEVIEYAFNDHESLSADTLIELVQISGNSQSPIGGPHQAKDKLLGLQTAHFAAFYKQSWRANTGRMGGSTARSAWSRSC